MTLSIQKHFVEQVEKMAQSVFENPEDREAFMDNWHVGIGDILNASAEGAAQKKDRIMPSRIATEAEANATIEYLNRIGASKQNIKRAFE